MSDADPDYEVHTALPNYMSDRSIALLVRKGLAAYISADGDIWVISYTEESYEYLTRVIKLEEPTCH